MTGNTWEVISTSKPHHDRQSQCLHHVNKQNTVKVTKQSVTGRHARTDCIVEWLDTQTMMIREWSCILQSTAAHQRYDTNLNSLRRPAVAFVQTWTTQSLVAQNKFWPSTVYTKLRAHTWTHTRYTQARTNCQTINTRKTRLICV